MVYKKSYGKKYSKKPSKRRAKPKQSKTKKLVKRMLVARGLNAPEIKHMRFDAVMGGVNTDFATAGQPLLPSVQGVTGFNDFIGKKITLKSINFRGMFYNENEIPCCVRVFIVEDLQAMDSSNLVLKGGSTTTRGYEILDSADFHSLYNDIYPRRWKMLYDRLFCIPGTVSGQQRIPFRKRVLCGNAAISYTPTITGTSMYGVNKNYILFMVADTDIQYTIHFDIAYTDV